MRRVILAVTGTIAGLVALLSFKAHVPTVPVASTSGTGGGSSTSSSSSTSSRTIPGEFQIEVVIGPFFSNRDAIDAARPGQAGAIETLLPRAERVGG